MDAYVPTSTIAVVETQHGRTRRRQRGIHKKDLQNAKKYGVKESYWRQGNGNKAAKYTWNNIVYITNEVTNEEITSYAIPIKLEKVNLTPHMQREYAKAQFTLLDKNNWKSNTVLVIDTSGSMRNADIWGARTRLDSVWVSVALDFLATRIENGAGVYDVVSIICMGDIAKVLIKEQPTTYNLYNKIIGFYRSQRVQPRSHGNYIPSLELAEELINSNTNDSCAIGICFISDGKPSDQNYLHVSKDECKTRIAEKIASLAKRFGRTLSFDTVGIGEAKDFEMLQHYGSNASLKLPSRTSNAIGDVLQSFATSVTTTQTDLTDILTSTQQQVRQIDRESKLKANEIMTEVSDDFYIYHEVKRFVWNERNVDGKWKGIFGETTLQHDEAISVAISSCPFGEGKERFAFRFYEVQYDGKKIVGKPLVAKESRFICEKEMSNDIERRKYAETFCKIQQLAGRIANEFNDKLDWLRKVDDDTPRIEMLDCCIYETHDINLGRLTVLVKERLDESKWQKWNANNGYVQGMKAKPIIDFLDEESAMLKLQNLQLGSISAGMSVLHEVDEELDEREEEDDHAKHKTIVFSPFDVAQAFSHFFTGQLGKSVSFATSREFTTKNEICFVFQIQLFTIKISRKLIKRWFMVKLIEEQEDV